jgi:hypothetical protein
LIRSSAQSRAKSRDFFEVRHVARW